MVENINDEYLNESNKCYYSIIIATFNSEAYLHQCLESIHNVFGHDCRVQVIIKDALSTDKTILIANYWKTKINLNIIIERDLSIYDAWNQALSLVKGTWVSFLGSDDLFIFNDKELFFDILKKNQVDLLTFPILFSSKDKKHKNDNKIYFTLEEFEKRMLLAHPGVLHQSSIFKEMKFDSTFKIAGDYEFLIRYFHLEGFDKIISSENETCLVQFNDGGVSSNPKHKSKLLMEILKIRKRHGLNMCDRFVMRIIFHVVLNAMLRDKGDSIYNLLLRFYLKSKRVKNV